MIYTPDLSAGALNGITRNTVFHIAKDLGLEIVQKRITRDGNCTSLMKAFSLEQPPK